MLECAFLKDVYAHNVPKTFFFLFYEITLIYPKAEKWGSVAMLAF